MIDAISKSILALFTSVTTFVILSALQVIFKSKAQNGSIGVIQFSSLLNELYNEREHKRLIEEIIQIASSREDKELNVTRFVALIEMIYLRQQPRFPMSICLHRVLEELRIHYLSEKRDYIEAGKVQEQIDELIRNETLRRQQLFIEKQNIDMSSLKQAHEEQYLNFKEGESLISSRCQSYQ